MSAANHLWNLSPVLRKERDRALAFGDSQLCGMLQRYFPSLCL